MHYPVIKKDC